MFLQNLRAKVGARLKGEGEAGFTLIELLVVMLILGILAAIALPAFFNQKEKAGDAKAKENAHSAQVAMETYSTDNQGEYTGVTVEALHEIEPTIVGEGEGEEPTISLAGISNDTYTINSENPANENVFTITNNAGTMSYTCTTGGNGGCPANEDWSK